MDKRVLQQLNSVNNHGQAAAQEERRRMLEEFKRRKELAKRQRKLAAAKLSLHPRPRPTIFASPPQTPGRPGASLAGKNSDSELLGGVSSTPKERLERQLKEWHLQSERTSDAAGANAPHPPQAPLAETLPTTRGASPSRAFQAGTPTTPMRLTTADLRARVAESARKARNQASTPVQGTSLELEFELLHARIESASKLSKGITTSIIASPFPPRSEALTPPPPPPPTPLTVPKLEHDKTIYERRTLLPPSRPIFKKYAYKIPRQMYLRVVDPQSGATLSEEIVPYRHVPLFRLQDIDFSKILSEKVAEAILVIAGAPCPANHVRCSAAHRQASYWVARAKIEEDRKNYEEVVRLYEDALAWDAQPFEEVQTGLKMFILRKVDESPMVAALQKKLHTKAQGPEEIYSSSDELSPPDISSLRIADSDEDDDDVAMLELPETTTQYIAPAAPSHCDNSEEEDQDSDSGSDSEDADEMTGNSARRVKNPSHADKDVMRYASRFSKHGTTTVLTPVRANNKLRKEYGVKSVVTPVRRSTRSLSRTEDGLDDGEKDIAELLSENGIIYMSNPAVKLSKSKSVISSTPSLRTTPAPQGGKQRDEIGNNSSDESDDDQVLLTSTGKPASAHQSKRAIDASGPSNDRRTHNTLAVKPATQRPKKLFEAGASDERENYDPSNVSDAGRVVVSPAAQRPKKLPPNPEAYGRKLTHRVQGISSADDDEENSMEDPFFKRRYGH